MCPVAKPRQWPEITGERRAKPSTGLHPCGVRMAPTLGFHVEEQGQASDSQRRFLDPNDPANRTMEASILSTEKIRMYYILGTPNDSSATKYVHY